MIAAATPKPSWLKVRPPGGPAYVRIKSLLRAQGLHTVCEEARCPNIGECWSGGTATFMLLGDLCTRACRFCAVQSGNPRGILDREEPRKVAEVAARLGLTYVVLTSVNRDDLPDGGAAHFAEAVREIKRLDPDILVEALVPDFLGQRQSVEKLLDARPDVFAHNVETIERLTPKIRDCRATYRQSLSVLRLAKESLRGIFTKSSLMLGVGETGEEIEQTLVDLREASVDIVTLGQYLRPSEWHLPVAEYVEPERFDRWRARARELGFLYAASGPLVRSSYRAGEFFVRATGKASLLVRDGPTTS